MTSKQNWEEFILEIYGKVIHPPKYYPDADIRRLSSSVHTVVTFHLQHNPSYPFLEDAARFLVAIYENKFTCIRDVIPEYLKICKEVLGQLISWADLDPKDEYIQEAAHYAHGLLCLIE